MANLSGSSTVEIDAPLERCWDLIADPEGTVAWQDSLKRAVVLERDEDGEPLLVDAWIDAVAREVKVTLRFDWDEHRELRWCREGGEIRDVKGAWTLEDLGNGRTRATYALEIDPGRVLGMLARGPVAGQIEKQLTRQPPLGLKAAAEGG